MPPARATGSIGCMLFSRYRGPKPPQHHVCKVCWCGPFSPLELIRHMDMLHPGDVAARWEPRPERAGHTLLPRGSRLRIVRTAR